MRAAILAIGTELTTGQIINRNAAWLASRLSDEHIIVSEQVTVADIHFDIMGALERLATTNDFILTTGGLGPTTDDFTREVHATWLGEKLEFRQSSWDAINDRLGRLGVKVAQSNRQQCYFPQSAVTYENPKGTAQAFAYEKKIDKKSVWISVFPGPPQELEATWESGGARDILDRMRRSGRVEKTKLFRWGVVGRSEAELGERVEEILKGTGLLTGYRPHSPYVEIKVWCPEKDLKKHESVIAALDQYLKPNTIVKDGEDLVDLILSSLLKKPRALRILDQATAGVLSERLIQGMRATEYRSLQEQITIVTGRSEISSDDFDFSVHSLAVDGSWIVQFGVDSEKFSTPYPKMAFEDRNRRYIAEISLHQLLERLK
ncbi:MAG: competence/damage-inducible protein A [Xanthomonadaceae bacterium]|nr:competence/damage-inducible protein A [Xanthomonadaceae bacterium]